MRNEITNIPFVSVLTTAYNREKYIGEAIESILASTYSDFELIIVDDCSTDGTMEVARQYERLDNRIKVYVNKKNLGDYPNRNKAASYATGKYIKYVDSDDIIYPYGLEVMVKCMERFPEAEWGLSAAGEEYRFYPVCLRPREIYLEHFGRFHHFDRAPGSAIIKTSVFREVGGFSGERMIGDYQLWSRLARDYNMVKMPRDLYWDRTHRGQERVSVYAQRYPVLRQKVLNAFLSDPKCPLNDTEISEIKKQLKAKNRRNKLMNFLKSMVQSNT